MIPESSERLYDIVASKTGHTTDDLLRRGLAEKAGLSTSKIDLLLMKFQSLPKVKIGSSVPAQKARQIKQSFEAAGLRIELEAVLSLAAMEQVADDGKIPCPACDERIELTEDRQCPACGVYVDKVSPEFIARKKLEREERKKLLQMEEFAKQKADMANRSSREEQLRNEIRKELEKELGIRKAKEKHRSPVTKAALMSLGALTFTTLGFGGGYMLPVPQATVKAENPDGLDIENMPPSGTISAEQAVEASTKLAASIGYSTPASLKDTPASLKKQVGAEQSAQQNREQTVKTGEPAQNFHTPSQLTESVWLLLQVGMVDAARNAVTRASAVQKPSPQELMETTVAKLSLEAWQLTSGQTSRSESLHKKLSAVAKAMPDADSRTRAFVALARVLSITQPHLYEKNAQLVQQAFNNAETVTNPVSKKHAVFSAFSARNTVLAACVKSMTINRQHSDAERLIGFFEEWSKTAPASMDKVQSALATSEQELPLQRMLGNTQRVQHLVQQSIKYFEATPGYERVEQMVHFSNSPEFWQNTRFQELLLQARRDLLADSDESGQLRPGTLRPMAALVLLYYRADSRQDGENLEKWLTAELNAHTEAPEYLQLGKQFGLEKTRVLVERAHAQGNQPELDRYAAQLVSMLP